MSNSTIEQQRDQDTDLRSRLASIARHRDWRPAMRKILADHRLSEAQIKQRITALENKPKGE